MEIFGGGMNCNNYLFKGQCLFLTDIGGIDEFVEAVEFSLCTACLAAKLAPCSATWEKPGCIAESQTEKKGVNLKKLKLIKLVNIF